MKILVAEHAGFCFGVKRAVECALSHANPISSAYTLGELIHNPGVVAQLKEKNLHPVTLQEALALPTGTKLIIRSHGVSPSVIEACREKGLALIDATCPFVSKIHKIVEKSHEEGRQIFIAGKPNHPEVEGILGWAGQQAVVIASPEEAHAVHPSQIPACLVSQTTFQHEHYKEIGSILKKKYPNINIYETTCDTTVQRQKEAAQLAKRCTKVYVLGGNNSSNTQKLAAICAEYCESTYSIEESSQVLLEKIQTDDIIGVVAGASTPQWMIREVVTVMNELDKATVESTEVAATMAQEEAKQEAENATEVEAAATAETVEAEEAVSAEQPEAAQEAKEPAKAAAPAAEEPTSDNDAGDNFAEAFEKTLVRIRNGQVIKGSVVQIVDGEVSVNISYKSDGYIPRNEFSSDPDVNPADVVKVGDTIEVEVLKVNDGEGNVLLSRKSVEGKKYWDDLVVEAENPDTVFEAIGKEVVKGGLIATIKGVRAFVPASHVSTKYVENLSEYVGKPMRLSVIEVDKGRKRIVASQKNVLISEQESAKKERWSNIEAGSKLTGVVRRLTDFGAFVDIGGIDGLVHVTDVAWGRVKHPSDVLKIGQEIEVLVLNVDADKERVSLGYKQLQPKPWTLAGDRYPVGSIVEGKVVRIVPFGAFVALEPTIDGLIHISQVGVRRIAKVEDEINVGDVVRCKVLDVNPEAKRISLSRREVLLEENPEIAEQIAAERAERDKQYAEKQEQRSTERQQRTARSERTESTPRPAASSAASPRPERQEHHRPRRNEDGDYDLPPVQSTTTSLADLFQGLNLSDAASDAVTEEEAPAKIEEPVLSEAVEETEE